MSKGKAASSGGKKTTEPRKGQVWRYVYTSKGLVPFEELRKAEMASREESDRVASAQIKELDKYMADNGLVPHPFNVAGIVALMENCSFFDACVRQIARDVVGGGYDLVDVESESGADAAEAAAEGAEEDSEKAAIRRFLDDPNTGEETILGLVENMVIDLGLCGWMAMEVARNEGRTIGGLYHMPASPLRVHKDGNKFCMIVGTVRRWFKRFGYAKDVDENTGQERDPGAGTAADNPLTGVPFKPAHEVIFYKTYSPSSAYYGAPNILPAIGSVRALIGIRDYNLSFFENYGVPAAMVTLTGEWDENAVKYITDFIDTEIKGTNNAHKTIVVNPPEGGTIEWKPLIVEVKEGHFKLYFQNLRDEVLVCYKMPPYRIGIAETGSLGGSTAAESTHIYIDSIVRPIQEIVNGLMTRKIIRDGLGSARWAFRLRELDLRDLKAIVDRDVILFGLGAMTANDILEDIGRKRLDPATNPWAERRFMLGQYREVGSEQATNEMEEQTFQMNEAFGKLTKEIKIALQKDREERLKRLPPPAE